MTKAIFLDKDGTVIENVPYNVDPGRMRFLPGSADGLRRLSAAGFELVVISNQAGVARGRFPEDALRHVATRLSEMLSEADCRLAGFYYCPHHPLGSVTKYAVECDCRKPHPGLIRLASRELDIDLESSWLIGDILSDIEAGNRAGCRTVLIDSGGETEWLPGPFREPSQRAANLDEAATKILSCEEMSVVR
jgi:D-glycero-D-manno-heptose 1,7-bisphosphate phosphatase